ncbi:site-specific integrase [Vibrio parahaemolyticus]|uniref:site-specific integrase n=1 Tax=Vibrio parahaemolyticus TaxID=670 RepID=UPI001E474226|nr:site-specific integrase [Vibrio parahaemolyticus]
MNLTRKEERIIVIEHVEHSEAEISTLPLSSSSTPVTIERNQEHLTYFITDPLIRSSDEDIYLLPFLLEADGTPWHLANQFLLDLAIKNKSEIGRKGTRDIRRKASMLLDYKIFCENAKDRDGNPAPINLFDFRSPFKSRRPTWRYYTYLTSESKVNPDSINSRTGVVYQFYKFAASTPEIDLDLERVESLTNYTVFKETHYGTIKLEGEKRSQTITTSSDASPVDIGFVRDEGEDLRPLLDTELRALLDALSTDKFKTDEKLIHYLALCTGERKQTILTLRLHHLNYFDEKHLLPNGMYKLFVSPQNGCDTKNNKPHVLHVSKGLADKIKLWADSPIATERREKFKSRFGSVLDDDDMYLFLSPTGDCRYMARNDPRYLKTKSPPTGQITRNLKKKLLRIVGSEISSDFTFHWLRATFAKRLYRRCQHLVAEGKMLSGSELNYIRQRMHHSDQHTTENYLKLFSSINERVSVQEIYEDSLFSEIFTEVM